MLGQELGRPVWSLVCPVVSVVVFVVFVAFVGYESRLAARGGVPLIAPRVLRVPGTAPAVLRVLLVMAVDAGFLFLMTPHVQRVLGYSPLRAGLVFAPTALVLGATGLTWRRWPAGLRRFLVPGGFVLRAAVGDGRRAADARWWRRRSPPARGVRDGGGRDGAGLRPPPSPGSWRTCAPRTRPTRAAYW
ncbi:hypothetical protein ACFCV8_28000 [Streptomyces sp. NPDC056347]|uniref:hypothetical protein n=1 Tax=Streptomyces sp. NPDC056347 TaxID=3345790 RepID=UPI0035D93726